MSNLPNEKRPFSSQLDTENCIQDKSNKLSIRQQEKNSQKGQSIQYSKVSQIKNSSKDDGAMKKVIVEQDDATTNLPQRVGQSSEKISTQDSSCYSPTSPMNRQRCRRTWVMNRLGLPMAYAYLGSEEAEAWLFECDKDRSEMIREQTHINNPQGLLLFDTIRVSQLFWGKAETVLDKIVNWLKSLIPFS